MKATSQKRSEQSKRRSSSHRPNTPGKTGKPAKATEGSFLVTEKDVFLRICEGINTPRSIACYMLAKHDEWSQYLDLSFPDVLHPRFADDYLVSSVMKKNVNLPGFTEELRDAAALAAFKAGEEQCRRTNLRFLDSDNNPIYLEKMDFIHEVRSWVARLLGPLNRKALDRIEKGMRFGPGATSSVRGNDVLLSKKYVTSHDVTPRLHTYVPAIASGLWYNPEKVKLIAYNRFVSVPKDAKRNRGICIEPTMNIFAQLGVGGYLKRRLSLFGLYPDEFAKTSDGQVRNREMCRDALSRDLATIDLSNASDTLSYTVVLQLLPPEWFQLFDLMRVEYTELPDGSLVKLEKFSSMGNGYTWELETLIFAAIALASGVELDDLATFGDDIICPVNKVSTVMENLEFFGFQVNRAKSFWQGPFRESCGHDYWYGKMVRPFYFKGEYHDTDEAVIHMANLVRLYAHRRGLYGRCDIRFLPAWLRAVKHSTRAKATGIAIGYGDEGLIKNFDEFSPSVVSNKPRTFGWQGYVGRVIHRPPKEAGERTDQWGAYLAQLHRPAELPRSREYLRGRVGKPQLRSLICFEWTDIGPWAVLPTDHSDSIMTRLAA